MERIFSGKVYEMVDQPNGIVFSYCKENLDNKARVRYQMISFDNRTVTEVAKNIYQLSKFGSNYRAVASLCSNYVSARAVILPTGRVFMIEDNGRAILFDDEGMPLWTGELTYRGNVPSDVAFHKNSLWVCYSSANVLLRFNLNTMREELRIGGNSSPFDKPCDIFIENNEAIISNAGSNKLIRFDLNSFSVSEHLEFSEAVYGYIKIKHREFALLESGIYLL